MKNIDDLSIQELEELENSIKQRKQELSDLPRVKVPWKSPVGLWKVTTEGDCEGRTTDNLGFHRGHIVDIAHRLGGHTMYSLNFRPANENDLKVSDRPVEKVHIQLDISSKTWDSKDRVKMVKEFLSREKPETVNYAVFKSNYYASTELRFVEL